MLLMDEKSYQEWDDEYIYFDFWGCELIECFFVGKCIECQQESGGDDEYVFFVYFFEWNVYGMFCIVEEIDDEQNGDQ